MGCDLEIDRRIGEGEPAVFGCGADSDRAGRAAQPERHTGDAVGIAGGDQTVGFTVEECAAAVDLKAHRLVGHGLVGRVDRAHAQ